MVRHTCIGVRALLVSFAILGLWPHRTDADGYLYSTDDAGGTNSRLLRIDPANASVQVVGIVDNSHPYGLAISGLDYNFADGYLYATDDAGGTNSRLLRIDPRDASVQVVGIVDNSHPYGLAISGLAYNSADGYLYGTDDAGGTNSLLLRIDPANASAQIVGTVENLPPLGISGLAYNSADGYLYGTDDAGGSNSRLLRINPANASAQIVGTVENLYSWPFVHGLGISGLAYVADFKWVGAGTGGKTGTDPSDPATLWSGMANWQIGVVPGASDTAYITLVNPGKVNAESASVGTLYVDGTSTDAALRIGPGVDFHVTRALHVGQNVAGTVMQTGGTCRVDGDLHLGQPGAGRGTYALYSGTLSVGGNLVNDGELRLGQCFNASDGVHIHGDYVQSGSGTLFVELRMDTSQTPNPAVVVDGKALLDGTLEVQLSKGVGTTAGQRFGIMSYDSVLGRFKTFKGSAIDGRPDLFFGLDYNKNSLSVMTLKVPTRADGTPMSANPKSNLVLVTHGLNGSIQDKSGGFGANNLGQIAGAINTFAGSSPTLAQNWDVVVFDWSEFAAIGLNWCEAERRGAEIGRSLADWMHENGLDRYSTVHLIGHSAGAWVIDSMANGLPSSISHLTFLDACVSKGKETIGQGAGAAGAAEQYFNRGDFDWTEQKLERAVNVDVTMVDPNPSRMDLFHGHRWPIDWYLSTCQHHDPEPLNEPGYGWGFTRSPMYRDFVAMYSDFDSATKSRYISALRIDHNDYGNVIPLPPQGSRPQPQWRKYNFADLTNVVSDTGTATVSPDGTVTLTTGSPVMLTTFLNFDQPADLLSFDFHFLSAAEGLLSVFFDGNQVLQIDERSVPEGVWNSGDVWFGYDTAPGTHLLLFRLDPYNDLQSAVEISNLQVGFTPEPATLSLLALGGLALLRRSRAR